MTPPGGADAGREHADGGDGAVGDVTTGESDDVGATREVAGGDTERERLAAAPLTAVEGRFICSLFSFLDCFLAFLAFFFADAARSGCPAGRVAAAGAGAEARAGAGARAAAGAGT